MSKKKKALRGMQFTYHCNICADMIVVESQCDDIVPFLINCFATPKCIGKMIRMNRDMSKPVSPVVYAYIWTKDVKEKILSLVERPGHPRYSPLFLAMGRVFQENRKARPITH